MNYRKFLPALALLALSGAAPADQTQPFHQCRKPAPPALVHRYWDVERFNRDLDIYRRCLDRFVQEQTEAAQRHRSAAAAAVDEWDTYQRRELR